MNRDIFEYRNLVLTNYFKDRTWDDNPEFRLMRSLVLDTEGWRSQYPYLIEYEWEVDPGHSNMGVGDLVFTDGDTEFAVVEVKFVDTMSSGRNKRNKRTKKRRQVEWQAYQYCQLYNDRITQVIPDASVKGYFFTDETPTPRLMRYYASGIEQQLWFE